MKLRANRIVISVCLLAGAVVARAQSVVAPSVEDPAVSAALAQAAHDRAPAPNSGVPASPGPASPFQWAGFTLQPHFLYRAMYADGIQSQPGHPLNSYIQNIAPGFLMDFGSHWTADYTPNWNVYSNRAFRDTLDQSAIFQGGYTREDWSLQFSQTYSFSSPSLVESGTQTSQNIYDTSLSLTRRLTTGFRLETEFNQNLKYYDGFPDSHEWSATPRLHYMFSPDVDASFGAGLGYVTVDPGLDTTYARPEAQVAWRVTEKLSFDATGGYETRRYLTGGIPTRHNPTFNASIRYEPFTITKFDFTATRTVQTSVFDGDITESTGWTANVEQRLFTHFQLKASYSAQKTHYVTTQFAFIPNVSTQDVTDDAGNVIGTETVTNFTVSNFLVPRDDQFHSLNVRLSTTFFKRGSVAVVWQKSHNSSSDVGYTFSSSQIGIEIGYKY